MLILYNYANSHDALVIGTGNKSEIYLGYSTKYGDSAADVLPLGDLYKIEVFELARELALPPSIINKRPSAELFAGQTDEKEMGISYQEADQILAGYLDQKMTEEELIKKFTEKEVKVVLSLVKNNEHKRISIPIIKKS